MKIIKCTLWTILSATLFCACGSERVNRLTGQVTMDGYEGRKVYLETTTTNSVAIDSAVVKDGRFAFTLRDSIPQVYTLVLRSADDDVFPITLPIVSEKGHIQVVMGELVLTMGTPLNDTMQDFLLAYSNFSDKIQQNEKIGVEQVREHISQFIEKAVRQNMNTPVGAYIYRWYAEFLTDTQKEGLLQLADEDFKKAVNQ